MGMSSIRIRHAIQQLMMYYENVGINALDLPGFVNTLHGSPVSRSFMHNGTSYPLVHALLTLQDDEVPGSYADDRWTLHLDIKSNTVTRNEEFRDSAGRLLLTLYDPETAPINPEIFDSMDGLIFDYKNVDALWCFLNASGQGTGRNGQGWRTPIGTSWGQQFSSLEEILGNPYSVKRHLIPSSVQKAAEDRKLEDTASEGSNISASTPVHVIQSFDPTSSPQGTDGDILTLLMSGIPTSEWSRCVPYFEMLILDPAFAKPYGNDALSYSLTTGWSEFGAAAYEYERLTGGNTHVAGAAELYTTPQTMAPYVDPTGNPSAPLFTVESFTTSESGLMPTSSTISRGKNIAETSKAELKIRVHDRTRLNQVLPYFRPGASGAGTTSFVITYGWSHPEGNTIRQNSSYDYQNLIGEVLNSARTTASYAVEDMNYTFVDTGEVDLTVSLVIAPQKDVFENASIAGGDAVSQVEVAQLMDMTVDMIEMMQQAGGGGVKMNLGNTYIAALKKDFKYDVSKVEALKDLQKQIRKEGYRARQTYKMQNQAQIWKSTWQHTPGGGGYEYQKGYWVPVTKEEINAEAAKYMAGARAAGEDLEAARKNIDALKWGQGGVAKNTDGEWAAIYEAPAQREVKVKGGYAYDPVISFDQFSKLADIFNSFYGEEDMETNRAAVASANATKIITALLDDLLSGPDPFLRPEPVNFPNKGKSCYTFEQFVRQSQSTADPKRPNQFVSLGKILTYFMTPTLTKLRDVGEVQIMYHVFNMDAAGVFSFNIAQFPLPGQILKKHLIEVVKKHGNIKLLDVIEHVINTYVNDETLERTHSFGLKGVSDSKKSKVLHRIYGDVSTSEKITPEVVVPKVRMKISQKPSRASFNEPQYYDHPQSPPVLRIEFYDQNCTASPFQKSIAGAQSGAILKKIRLEDRTAYVADYDRQVTDREDEIHSFRQEGPGEARHLNYYLQEAVYFEKHGYIVDLRHIGDKDVENYVNDLNAKIKKKDPKAKEIKKEEFAELIKSYFFLTDTFTAPQTVTTYKDSMGMVHMNFSEEVPVSVHQTKVKERIQYTMRERAGAKIDYGAATSSVIKLTLQTNQDKQQRDLGTLNARNSIVLDADEKQGIARLGFKIPQGHCEIECYGNPYLRVGQEIFVDMNTRTGMDGLYTVLEVSHDISPGDFRSKVKLKPGTPGPTVVDSKRSVFDFVAATLGAPLAGI